MGGECGRRVRRRRGWDCQQDRVVLSLRTRYARPRSSEGTSVNAKADAEKAGLQLAAARLGLRGDPIGGHRVCTGRAQRLMCTWWAGCVDHRQYARPVQVLCMLDRQAVLRHLAFGI